MVKYNFDLILDICFKAGHVFSDQPLGISAMGPFSLLPNYWTISLVSLEGLSSGWSWKGKDQNQSSKFPESCGLVPAGTLATLDTAFCKLGSGAGVFS
jgi:hypothetical protein